MCRLCRDTKADLSLVGPPTPQQVIGAAARNIEKGLTNVNIDVAKYFAPIASRMLESGVGAASTPVQILAVTMAQMSGYTDLPKEKSILGQAEGALTLGINTPAGRGFSSPGALVGSLRRITSEAVAGSVGKVELFDEPEEAGYEAAFDVPKDVADEIIEAGKTHGAPPPQRRCPAACGCAAMWLPFRSCTRVCCGRSDAACEGAPSLSDHQLEGLLSGWRGMQARPFRSCARCQSTSANSSRTATVAATTAAAAGAVGVAVATAGSRALAAAVAATAAGAPLAGATTAAAGTRAARAAAMAVAAAATGVVAAATGVTAARASAGGVATRAAAVATRTGSGATATECVHRGCGSLFVTQHWTGPHAFRYACALQTRLQFTSRPA